MFNQFIAKLFKSADMNVTSIPAAHDTAMPTLKLQSPSKHNPLLHNEISKLKLEAGRLEHGLGIEQDMAKAISLYQKGAELGGALAIYKLAGFYAEGIHLPQDRALAAMWYRIGMNLHANEPVFASKYECLMSKRSDSGTAHHVTCDSILE
jgi:TPR repeat protein